MQKPLPLRRRARLAENILFCLYEGEIQRLDIHQKPEDLHYGIDKDTIETIPWRDENARILDIKDLKNTIKFKTQQKSDPFTSADFSLEMVEGTEQVSYRVEKVVTIS